MLIRGRVINPNTVNQADGAESAAALGKQGQLLAALLGGVHYETNMRGGLFRANVTAVTIPVVAATLVSVFGLDNPRNSGVNMELVSIDITSVLATLVVNTYGLYFSADKNADTATFTTKGTVQNGAVDGGPARNKGQFYSAVTHVGTPVRCAIIGGHHATTSGQAGEFSKKFDGSLIIPPGTLVSVAASTAASTISGLDLEAVWAERPFAA